MAKTLKVPTVTIGSDGVVWLKLPAHLEHSHELVVTFPQRAYPNPTRLVRVQVKEVKE